MAKGKKKIGLGRTLIKQRFNTNPSHFMNQDGMVKNNHTVLEEEHVNMTSITEENDLSAFLNHAQLADKDFTAEKLNITILSSSQPQYLLDEEGERKALAMHDKFKDCLKVPRRPEWNAQTTREELIKMEKDSFLEWRRQLVHLEEEQGLVLTPYERNLEVWRQLWRVIEKSELLVQIVDARHPLFFQSKDLETYVSQTHKKLNLLLVNKADLLTVAQREAWGKYFDEAGVPYCFFSAALAREEMEDVDDTLVENDLDANDINQLDPNNLSSTLQNDGNPDSVDNNNLKQSKAKIDEIQNVKENEEAKEFQVPKGAQILGALELVELLQNMCPQSEHSLKTGKRTIGFVGYPNVGKSSTLNALVGATKVTVSSTPGKTKHFQTIHLSDEIILCDCPGLVFPSFATTKAEMVCNGVLPIDQLREWVGPASLITKRIPKHYLQAIYGLTLKTLDLEGRPSDRQPTGVELLQTFARARGYTKSSQGNPDESRAARYILKDYVNGKLLYVHPPPGYDGDQFNHELYTDAQLLAKRINLRVEKPIPEQMTTIDKEFFGDSGTIRARIASSKVRNDDFSRVTIFPYQTKTEKEGDGKNGKKSHKKERRKKVHVNWTRTD